MEAPKKREMIGIIIFDGEKFLLLHRVLHWDGWEFPKGGMMEGESPEEAIKRELFEETGAPKFEIISEIDKAEFFDSVRKSDSHVTNYLVRIPSTTDVTFENQETFDNGQQLVEHDKFKWFLPGEAVETVTHENQKESLRKAIGMLGIGAE